MRKLVFPTLQTVAQVWGQRSSPGARGKYGGGGGKVDGPGVGIGGADRRLC